MNARNAFCGVLLMLAAAVGGCGPVISWVVGQFQRPKKVAALYRLEPKQHLLVFVESPGVEGEMLCRDLTDLLNRQLRAKGLVRRTIPYAELMAMRLSRRDFGSLGIVAVGRALRADQVLYVHVDRFSLKDNPADVLWRGRLEVTVRVVRTAGEGQAGGVRLWPKDRPKGYPVGPVVRDPTVETSAGYRGRLRRALATDAADQIAKLFYTHRLSGVDAWQGKPTGQAEEIPQ